MKTLKVDVNIWKAFQYTHPIYIPGRHDRNGRLCVSGVADGGCYIRGVPYNGVGVPDG